MSMRLGVRSSVVALALTAGVLTTASGALAQAPAMPGGAQGMLLKDVANLSDKFTGLARVMAGKYDWRPGPGVRTVADVFNLIVNENTMLAGLLSGSGGQGRGGGMGGAPVTDPAALQQALANSYTAVSQALAALSPADLSASVKLFGQDTTKQGAVLILLMDQHEHLGQSIAYARTNGVVPPWSK